MSSTDVGSGASAEAPEVGTVDMKLEVVTLPVSDVDRATSFYQGLGWRLDADFNFGEIRGVQLTPTRSNCSISFGTGLTTAEPGSAQRLELVVDDIDAAREELIGRGVEVSEPFTATARRCSRALTRSVARTSPMPRSRTRMATAGFSRKSRADPQAGCGTTDEARRSKTRLTARGGYGVGERPA
jgi:catechol 2,3-dioxygenase-like lactoylglutathione lyase family enzyme